MGDAVQALLFAIARATAKQQVQDTLWTLLGDVGTTQPLLLRPAQSRTVTVMG